MVRMVDGQADVFQSCGEIQQGAFYILTKAERVFNRADRQRSTRTRPDSGSGSAGGLDIHIGLVLGLAGSTNTDNNLI